MKDFRIVARIYNNQLRERREALGLSACAFAKKIGVFPSRYCEYESMKRSPLTKGTDAAGNAYPKRWRLCAQQIAGALGVEPEVLWPDAVLEIGKTVAELKVDSADIAAMLPPAESSPFLLLAAAEESAALADAVSGLSQREQSIIARHYAKGESLDDIATDEGVTRERIRQITQRAINKLRRHSGLKTVRAGRAA